MIKINLYYLFLILFVSVFVTTFAYHHSASAQQSRYGIEVSPSIIELSTKNENVITQQISLKNISETASSYNFRLIQLEPSNNKNNSLAITKTDTNTTKLFQNISILDNNEPLTAITLEAKQEKRIVLQINLTKSIPMQDHYFAAVFESQSSSNDPEETYSSVIHGAGTVILLSYNSKTEDNLAIEKLNLPFFNTKGPVKIELSLKNNGKQYVKPYGTVVIQNMFGKVVNSIQLEETILLPDTAREIGQKVSGRVSFNQENDHSITRNDNFLLGLYRIKADIRGHNTHIPLTAERYAVVLPVYTILPLVVLFLLLIRFYLRVKRKIVSTNKS